MTGRRLRNAAVALLLAASCSSLPAHAAPSIAAARLVPTQDTTRVTLESAAPLTYRLFTIPDPARVVLDIESTETLGVLEALAAQLTATDPLVKAVRVGRFKPGIARLVIELKTDAQPKVTQQKVEGRGGHRTVLEIFSRERSDAVMALLESKPTRNAPTSPPATATAAPASDAGLQTAAEPAQARAIEPAAQETFAAWSPAPRKTADAPAADKAPPRPVPVPVNVAARVAPIEIPAPEPRVERLVTVAVDAGHGGEDPGAKGRNGTFEKQVTLAIARKLKDVVDGLPNMRAVLVRDADYFVPLQARVVKARSVQADLFVSIHADAFVKPNARGSSVFALSERGATSAAARWIAKRENDADLIGGVNIDVPDPFLKKVLLDLSQTATINDSLKLGRAVLGELGAVNSLHKARVEQAGFAVLKAPDMPSILVETAFISNPEEEERLTDEAYQEKLARAIAGGIKRYFARNPPLARAHLAKSDTPAPITEPGDASESGSRGRSAGMQFAVFDPASAVEKPARTIPRRGATLSGPTKRKAPITQAGRSAGKSKASVTCKRTTHHAGRPVCPLATARMASRR